MNIFFPNASINYPPKDGPHVHQYQLIKQMSERGWDFTTLWPDENPNVRVLPRSRLAVIRMLRSTDVLYCRTNEGLSVATALTAPNRRWLIPRRTPVVWQMDIDLQLVVGPGGRDQQAIDRDLLGLRERAKRVDAAIGVTDSITQQAKDLLGIERAFTIQNASDPQMFSPDLPPPPAQQLQAKPDHLQVAWIGSHSNRIHDAKLIGELCELIDQRQLPIQVHVIGRTQSLFEEPLPKSMALHGPVSYMELPNWLAAMDVGLVLYNIVYDGGSPLKLFDYLASGCVPICSPGQPMQQVLSHGQIGFIGEWRAQTLCDKLVELANDPGELKQRSAAGRRAIEEQYSWQRVAEQTDQILRDALSRRRGMP